MSIAWSRNVDGLLGTHRLDGSDETKMLHADSLVYRTDWPRTKVSRRVSRLMQQCSRIREQRPAIVRTIAVAPNRHHPEPLDRSVSIFFSGRSATLDPSDAHDLSVLPLSVSDETDSTIISVMCERLQVER